jgi:hypothetical protein
MRSLRLALPCALLALLAGALAAAPALAAPKTKWLCKPGLEHNACRVGLRTTTYSPAGKKLGVRTPRVVRPKAIDCFYVYPTVSDQMRPNATRRIDPEERSIALYQAARYGQLCHVYAPMYRQLTLQAINGGTRGSTKLAHGDVKRAWLTYLRRYNHGRGVVIIGHSQGSFMLRALLTKVIDKHPSQRRRMVSAILLGGNVLVKKGKDAGGDFKHIPACRSRTQIGCVIAFSTYDQTPPAGSLFGRSSEKGEEVLCTNPAALGGGSALLHPISPSAPFAKGTLIAAAIGLLELPLPHPKNSTWVSIPRSYRGHCSGANGASVLRIAARGGAPTPAPSPTPGWGLHLLDANIALGDLVSDVRAEARAWLQRYG